VKCAFTPTSTLGSTAVLAAKWKNCLSKLHGDAPRARPSKQRTSNARTGKVATDGETLYYRARTRDCRSCPLKSQCCPKVPLRRIPRSIYEEARDVARALAKTAWTRRAIARAQASSD